MSIALIVVGTSFFVLFAYIFLYYTAEFNENIRLDLSVEDDLESHMTIEDTQKNNPWSRFRNRGSIIYNFFLKKIDKRIIRSVFWILVLFITIYVVIFSSFKLLWKVIVGLGLVSYVLSRMRLNFFTIFSKSNLSMEITSELHLQKLHKRYSYTGVISIPSKVYVNDSKNIEINVSLDDFIYDDVKTTKLIQGDNNTKFQIQLCSDEAKKQFLEVEILAAGITVDGSRKQRQSIMADVLKYYWNLYFANSGRSDVWRMSNKVFRLKGQRKYCRCKCSAMAKFC